MINNNEKGLHKPAWTRNSQLLTATSALSCMCAGEGDNERYMYYLVSTSVYRVDTYSDNNDVTLSPLLNLATTGLSARYSGYSGYRCNCLGCPTASSITVPGISKDILKGKKLRIVSGTGAGQERYVTEDAGPVIYDSGMSTGGSVSTVIDINKRFGINEHIGRQVRITYGVGAGNIANILYNNENTLTVADANFQQLDPWNNTNFTATIGAGCGYIIEDSTLTVDKDWTITPDETSTVLFETGGIYVMTPLATSFSQTEYYDIIRDKHFNKTNMGSFFTAAIPADFSLDRTGRKGGVIVSSQCTGAGTTTTIPISITGNQINKYRNYEVIFTGGTGAGQRGRIVGNNLTLVFIHPLTPLVIAPDATTTFDIIGESQTLYFVGGNRANIMINNNEYDIWSQQRQLGWGTCRNISAQYGGQEAFAISTVVRATGGITAVASAPTVAGTLYSVGDILTVTGLTGKVRVDEVGVGGVVTVISLYACGSGYTTGAGKTIAGGTGSGCTINISSIGVVARVTTAINHNLVIDDPVNLSGFTEALYNAQYNVLATDGLTVFDIATTATANGTATASQSTTVLVDSTKNYPVNCLKDRLIQIQTGGIVPTTQIRKIISNTAQTITFATIVAGVNGTSRYVILEPNAIGMARQYRQSGKESYGFATGGTSATLVKSDANWFGDMWKNRKMRVISGTGWDKGEVTITGNNQTTLNLTTPGFTPDTTTQFEILDMYGTATAGTTTTLTDSFQAWQPGLLVGKMLAITGGNGSFQYLPITANTANQITFATAVAPDTTSTYTILDMSPRGVAGVQINWLYGMTGFEGRYALISKGGTTNTFDILDITNDRLSVQIFTSPWFETYLAGSMFTYDGKDTLYIAKQQANLFTSIVALNVVSGRHESAGTPPWVNSTAISGNRFEMMTTPNGAKCLYLLQNTGVEVWKGFLSWL